MIITKIKSERKRNELVESAYGKKRTPGKKPNRERPTNAKVSKKSRARQKKKAG